MPGALSVQVRGVDSLADRIRLLRPRMRRATIAAVTEAGQGLEDGMKALAPVDTGRLRDSIRHEVEGTTATAGPGREVDYAIFVEFGTSRMPAQPYVRPVVQAEKLLFPALVRKHLDAELKRGGRR
ncbi:HK97-gp10 family putative phage morphogenesis protein [Nocardiopsis lucentensis]|uniref:HK97-gp10 family putative phage morphogenesis protein n=1 Tax=Nocardiopsis lucentensis TaxID=53441 RepID=UPI0003638A25|nr:HK97-gp10 family putative phage morphogenesis protein [Nocardiopsis lucentensis]